LKIKKNTPCLISEPGHNNFYYPIFNASGLTYFDEDTENIEIKSWLCSHHNLRAVVVNIEDIKNLYGGNTQRKTVVWVEDKYLKNN